VHLSEREVYGTQIDRKLQKRILHCTFTYQREPRKCSTVLWKKSMSSFLWTWDHWWKRETKRGNGCVASAQSAMLQSFDPFYSGNGPRKSCLLDWSQYGTSTSGQRLSVHRCVQTSYSRFSSTDVFVTGLICEVYPSRNKHQGTDKRNWIWFHRPRGEPFLHPHYILFNFHIR